MISSRGSLQMQITKDGHEILQLPQKTVFRSVVAVADDGLAILYEATQSLALAGVTGGDECVASGVAQH